MIKVGLLPKLIKLLAFDEINKQTILGLLYHLSMDDKVKAMFAGTECVSFVSIIFSIQFKVFESRVRYKFICSLSNQFFL